MPRAWAKMLAGAVAVAGMASGCSSDDPEGADGADAAAGAEAPTTSVLTGAEGGDGAGDPYFPQLGNGGYDVERYDLAIDWSADDGVIDATATITMSPTEPLETFNLDLVGLDVERVRVDGRVARFTRDGGELTVVPAQVLPADRGVVVIVAYGGRPQPIRVGTDVFQVGWHTDGRGAFVVSEPAGAATWFPANDHPSDKARFRFSVTVPDDLEVLANGPLAERRFAEGRTTWVYEPSDPMATYLASVVVGDLLLDDTIAGRVPLRSGYPPGLADSARADFADTARMLAVFEDWFGRYPFDVYGHVVVDEDLGFALENQTLSLFGADLISAARPIDGVVAHELAHQWFGNAVSPETWRDIWLNEGFATYAEWIWAEAAGGPTIAESAAAAHSRADFGIAPGDPGAEELFHPTVYQRGALALHALSEAIGRDTFRALLVEWVARHDDDVASTDDLVRLAEELSGQQLDELVDRWVYGVDLPPLP